MITALSNIKAVSLGQCNTNFLDGDGRVWVCGWNEFGQLGVETPTVSLATFTQIPNIPRISAVAAFFNHTIFLDENKAVWSVGWNTDGQLGLGDFAVRNTPTRISTLPEIDSISVGCYHSLFTDTEGCVWACGSNRKNQLGLKEPSLVHPVPSKIRLKKIKFAEAGGLHSVFIRELGEVWTCGIFAKKGPRKLNTELPIVQASAGTHCTVLLDCEGDVWIDTHGTGTITKITNIPKINAIKCAPFDVLLLDWEGAVWGFGKQFTQPKDNPTPEKIPLPRAVSVYSRTPKAKSARKI